MMGNTAVPMVVIVVVVTEGAAVVEGLRPPPRPPSRPSGESGDANQGREMTVAVRENQRLNLAYFGIERVADRAR
jgi:hypothetical protein